MYLEHDDEEEKSEAHVALKHLIGTNFFPLFFEPHEA
jgi:hypothetical protein